MQETTVIKVIASLDNSVRGTLFSIVVEIAASFTCTLLSFTCG